ncbi:apoptosis inhibitor 5-like [Gigantopelta aegis]|uniref:apoptosis inhibitor 5-like n=1 Tax=Gigantopelta aegis TaxID=1735272 RepID=UPI001B88A6FB|nr:apoptosis inhibitor 5-like [Gigantopelta aegis]
MTTVENLYKNFGVLADAKDKAGEHLEEYQSFLEAVKGSTGEKRLAAQFIARFFKYFPDLATKAINSLFDLCEDSDITIRKQAIKELPHLCKVCPEHVPKISEALTQLLACDDSGELGYVQSSLVSLFPCNAKGTLEGIFSQILAEHEEDDVVRDRAIKFLVLKLRNLEEDTVDKDAEDYIMTEAKKVLQDVTKDEFISIMDLLKNLKVMSTVTGRQQLVDIVTDQADLEEPFEPTDMDCVDRLISCIKTATPLFSKNVHSKAFVAYICDHVLPVLNQLARPSPDVNPELEILRLFAEISEFCGELDKAEERMEKLYNRLTDYMPLPPSSENDTPEAVSEEPKLNFSFVECLIFAFHQLGKRSPGFLTDEANQERLKDFKLRLQFFARGVQVYIKQLRAALQGKAGDSLKTEENKLKVVALKTTSNINTLIKDLFHTPPAYKSSVSLSWKPLMPKATTNSKSVVSPGQKRITPITFESNGTGGKKPAPNSKHEGQQLYAPPSGKFSNKAGNYPNTGERGGGGRGRGRGFRGYGRGRGQGWTYNRW